MLVMTITGGDSLRWQERSGLPAQTNAADMTTVFRSSITITIVVRCLMATVQTSSRFDGRRKESCHHAREEMSKKFGDTRDPLLVSVRSGARGLDARHDEHDSEPRPQRRSRGRSGQRDAERAVRLRLATAA